MWEKTGSFFIIDGQGHLQSEETRFIAAYFCLDGHQCGRWAARAGHPVQSEVHAVEFTDDSRRVQG